MSTKLNIENFVDLSSISEKSLFQEKFVGDLLGKDLTAIINSFLDEFGVKDDPVAEVQVPKQAIVKGRVYIAKGATIEPTAYIMGPCYIGPEAQIRHGSYIRGSVFVGQKAVVGHATEVKGSIFFPEAKAGHFGYVGDSILGTNVNLGAGTKLANLKFSGTEVRVRLPDGTSVNTGHRKFGAILGDNAQTGCNAVLSPGTLLYPNTAITPCLHYHGTLTEGVAR